MVIPVHPAGGLGDLLPGWHVVPQNPIRDASTPVVASVTARAGGAVVKVPTMGELLAASFVVPQNPLRQALASPPGSGVPGTKGLGCGTCHGMGDATGLMGSLASGGTSIVSWLQQPSFIRASIPNWGLVAGAVVAYMLIAPGGSQYRSESRALRSRHRGYRRLAAAVA